MSPKHMLLGDGFPQKNGCCPVWLSVGSSLWVSFTVMTSMSGGGMQCFPVKTHHVYCKDPCGGSSMSLFMEVKFG